MTDRTAEIAPFIVERNSRTVLAFAGQLGLSESALVELFRVAATITA